MMGALVLHKQVHSELPAEKGQGTYGNSMCLVTNDKNSHIFHTLKNFLERSVPAI